MMKRGLEQRERPSTVNLRIVKPEGDKHYMVGFDAMTDEQAEAYNEAVEFYLEQEKLRPFHQVGSEGGSGYSAWEVWGETDEELLEKILSKIEQAAQIFISKDDEKIEELYDKWYPPDE